MSEFSLSIRNYMVHTVVNTNLILMDPCMSIKFINAKQAIDIHAYKNTKNFGIINSITSCILLVFLLSSEY